MRILVTGASGFIGGRFARFALEQGLDVRVSGRRAEGVEHLVKRGAQFIPGDLGDAEPGPSPVPGRRGRGALRGRGGQLGAVPGLLPR